MHKVQKLSTPAVIAAIILMFTTVSLKAQSTVTVELPLDKVLAVIAQNMWKLVDLVAQSKRADAQQALGRIVLESKGFASAKRLFADNALVLAKLASSEDAARSACAVFVPRMDERLREMKSSLMAVDRAIRTIDPNSTLNLRVGFMNEVFQLRETRAIKLAQAEDFMGMTRQCSALRLSQPPYSLAAQKLIDASRDIDRQADEIALKIARGRQ